MKCVLFDSQGFSALPPTAQLDADAPIVIEAKPGAGKHAELAATSIDGRSLFHLVATQEPRHVSEAEMITFALSLQAGRGY